MVKQWEIVLVVTTNSYRCGKTLEGLKIFTCYLEPSVGIYFVNNGTNCVSFEMVRTKKI